MLGEPALVDAEVGTEVGGGLLCVQHTPVLPAVDEHRHVAAVHLDRALAVGVVPVVRHVAILRESRQAVGLHHTTEGTVNNPPVTTTCSDEALAPTNDDNSNNDNNI